MRYTLMHKAIPVAALTLDSHQGSILSVDALHNMAHLPVGVPVAYGHPVSTKLAEWWASRSIPSSRQGLQSALKKMKMPTPLALARESCGLSLSDQYWIRPENSELQWEDVNFFCNPYSKDVGDILFGNKANAEHISLMSPDSTTDGRLQKRWRSIYGKHILLKGGLKPCYQEPMNEELASALACRLGIPHVDCATTQENGLLISMCEDFITLRTELVTAYQICETMPFSAGDDLYAHYLGCCDSLGIPGVRDSLDQMLVLDYLIANTDRHFGNFGAVRDADTLEWIGPAPLFDSGTSLWCEAATDDINAYAYTKSKTFYQYHSDQIELVTSFGWLDLSELDDIEDAFSDILADNSDIDRKRRRMLCSALRQRIELLDNFIRGR